MKLRAIADELWEVEDRIRMPGGVWLPLRMTVARLPGRELWIHSPVHLDDATAAAIDALGDVAHLVAPNRLHHVHLPAAASRWPRARTWAPAGLEAKRKEPHLRLERLDEAAKPPWADAIDLVAIDGAPWLQEAAFLHRPSRSMVCADLIFHVTSPVNARTRFVLWLAGASRGRLTAGREWRFLIRDRPAARASLERIMAWDVDRLIPAHGSILDRGARAALPGALRRIAGRRQLGAGQPR